MSIEEDLAIWDDWRMFSKAFQSEKFGGDLFPRDLAGTAMTVAIVIY